MKIFNKITCLFLGIALVTSCSNRDDSNPTPTPTPSATTVNDFVWKGLNSWYYWQNQVPNLSNSLTSTQYSTIVNGKNPDALFYSLLYDYPVTDRFSWIVSDVNSLLQSFSGISKSSGMDLDLYYKDSGKLNIVGIVNYVIVGSPAANAGIKRGDIVSGVNGADLNVNNYTQLFADQFTPIIAQNVSVATDGTITTSGVSKNPSITAVTLEENPVAFYKNYKLFGKNIGYLVYNGFKSNYNDELNAAFAKMKQDGVTELVLDLRYNGGGSVETAVALGQMITGQFTGNPYVIMDFNDKHNQYDSTEALKSTVNTYDSSNKLLGSQSVSSLNLSKIYVLTSHGTASASELTIGGLRSYINVVTIGSETYGKFVGSITLFDSPAQDYISYENRNKNHNWAMQPIVFSYYNAKKDLPTKGGFLPNYEIAPKNYFGTLKEFGDYSNDVGLKKALELITGQSLRTSATKIIKENEGEFIGNRRTLTKFGTEMYINNFQLK